MIRSRGRLWFLTAAAAALALCLGALAARPFLERTIRTRIETEAARQGVVARMDGVRVGLWPPVRLTGLSLKAQESSRLTADSASKSGGRVGRGFS
jgi:hypothetical protein